MKNIKTNTTGIAHFLFLAVSVVVVTSIVGTYYLVSSKAEQLDPVASSAALSSISYKYNLQSYYVQRLDGRVLANYRATAPPKEPASLLKPVIADIAIRFNGDMNSRIRIESKHLYGCGLDGNHRIGQTIKLKTAINLALRNSDNVAANALISFGGGLEQVNARVHGPLSGGSYQSTRVVDYYKCSGNNNATSAQDVSQAMQTIFTTNSRGYTIARSALKGAAKTNNYWQIPRAYANKYGATNEVSGNSAIIKRGSKKYIITVYANRPNAGSDIRGATIALANLAPRLNH